MSRFKRINSGAPYSMAVWSKGDDSCGNPHFEIHAPNPTRVAAPNDFLLLFVDPSERQFATFAQRSKWLKFPTYRKAQQYARGLT